MDCFCSQTSFLVFYSFYFCVWDIILPSKITTDIFHLLLIIGFIAEEVQMIKSMLNPQEEKDALEYLDTNKC